MAQERPKVGIAAVIRDAHGRLLVGKRKGSHGAGTWQFPGGHLEFGEGFAQCAEREVEEETALKVKASKIIAITNDVFETENKHYITLFSLCEKTDPEAVPQLLEPNKCEAWHWKTWEELQEIDKASGRTGERLFLPMIHLLRQTSSLDHLIAQTGL